MFLRSVGVCSTISGSWALLSVATDAAPWVSGRGWIGWVFAPDRSSDRAEAFRWAPGHHPGPPGRAPRPPRPTPDDKQAGNYVAPHYFLGICLPRPSGEGVTRPGGAAESGLGSEGREARISSKGYRSQYHKRAQMLLEWVD